MSIYQIKKDELNELVDVLASECLSFAAQLRQLDKGQLSPEQSTQMEVYINNIEKAISSFLEELKTNQEEQDGKETYFIKNFFGTENSAFKKLTETIFEGQKMYNKLSSVQSAGSSPRMMSLHLLAEWAKEHIAAQQQENAVGPWSNSEEFKKLGFTFQALYSGMVHKIDHDTVWKYIQARGITQQSDVNIKDIHPLFKRIAEEKADWLERVKNDGLALKDAPIHIKQDVDVVGEACTQNSSAMQYASEDLQKIINENINDVQNGKPIADVPDFLKRNKLILYNALYADTIKIEDIQSDMPQFKHSCQFISDFKKALETLKNKGSSQTAEIIGKASLDLDGCLKTYLTVGAQEDNKFRTECVTVINTAKDALTKVEMKDEAGKMIDQNTITLQYLKNLIFTFVKDKLSEAWERPVARFLLAEKTMNQLDELDQIKEIGSQEKLAPQNAGAGAARYELRLGGTKFTEKNDAQKDANNVSDRINGNINKLMDKSEDMLLALKFYKLKYSSVMPPEEKYFISSAITSLDTFRDNFVRNQNIEDPFSFMEKLTIDIYPMVSFQSQLAYLTAEKTKKIEDGDPRLDDLKNIGEKNKHYLQYIPGLSPDMKDLGKYDESPDIKKMEHLSTILAGGINKELEGEWVWKIIKRSEKEHGGINVDAIKNDLVEERKLLLEKRATALWSIYEAPDQPYKGADKKELMNSPEFCDNANFIAKLSSRMQAVFMKSLDLADRGEAEASKNMRELHQTIEAQLKNVLEVSKTDDKAQMKAASVQFRETCTEAITDVKEKVKKVSGLTSFLDQLIFTVTGFTLFHKNTNEEKKHDIPATVKTFGSEIIEDSSEKVIEDLERYILKPRT